MSRPLKDGLDYFPLDVTFFDSCDPVEPLLLNHGIAGTSIYLYLLCKAYREKGYYVEWNQSVKLKIARLLDISPTKTEQVVTFLLGQRLLQRIDVQGSAHACPMTVFTSPGIQKRFQKVMSERVRKKQAGERVEVDARIWLLGDKTDVKCIKVIHPGVIPRNNPNYSAEKPNYSAEKVHKEKKRKEKERDIYEPEPKAPAHLAPPSSRTDHIREIIKAKQLLEPEPAEALVRYIADRDEQEGREVSDQRIKAYTTRLSKLTATPAEQVKITAYATARHWKTFYASEDAKASGSRRPQRHPAGTFANFDQRTYDYQNLEAQLLMVQQTEATAREGEIDPEDVLEDAVQEEQVNFSGWVERINQIRARMKPREIDSIDWIETQFSQDHMLHYVSGEIRSIEDWEMGRGNISMMKLG